ncbi:hypothetical protein [Acetobacter ascendens]|uniref:Uncharacterized protein n=1 Tax=Acetobacter ascendens TaxID=481146 RepID=A0A1D8QWJ5_9PROT|nr:hypothetical protein [Acetobacter ascendens]AOW46674.1 hypothetical protein A4S02_07710 [Acetobacter ascendens]AOW49286.1 hypothetical protein A4R89_07495 [Acetobacter ascendens]RCL08203.1 hypothetical protein BBA71_04120 [Acetobacter pasteurianus]
MSKTAAIGKFHLYAKRARLPLMYGGHMAVWFGILPRWCNIALAQPGWNGFSGRVNFHFSAG